MKKIWVLVADGSRARLFKAAKAKELIEINAFEHPLSKLPGREIVSARPGRTHASVGEQRSSMEPPTSPHEHELIVFVKELAAHLEKGRTDGEFERLYIVASPTMLGLLRKEISEPCTKLVEGEIIKDATQMKPKEIRTYLPDQL